MGAHLALAAARTPYADAAIAATTTGAVTVHALAASLAAETPFGPATAPASRIAEFVRPATALCTRDTHA
ncbi:hypothetical protein L2U97_14385, partial [Staphylococcus aureus]|nr:hypothetical protein [Staphylococcus aureus]